MGEPEPGVGARVRAVKGGSIKMALSARRYTPALSWHKTPRVTKMIRILGIAGLATSAYAIIHVDDLDPLIDQIISEIDAANVEQDAMQRKVALMLVVNDINLYLSNFDPTTTSNLSLGVIYHMLGQDDW